MFQVICISHSVLCNYAFYSFICHILVNPKRREPEEKRKEVEEKHKNNQDQWLAKLEDTVLRMRRESEERKKAKEQLEEGRRKLIEEKKIKQEELIRK